MKSNQTQTIANMIRRKTGATVAELMVATWSSCVHKRLSDLKRKGWSIRREPIKGRTYGRYFGTPPATAARTATFTR